MRARARDKERCQRSPPPPHAHTHTHTLFTINTAQRITQLQHILEILSPKGCGKEGQRDDRKVGAGEEITFEPDLRELADGPEIEQQRTGIDILVGDMNALTASDYTSEQWEVFSTSPPSAGLVLFEHSVEILNLPGRAEMTLSAPASSIGALVSSPDLYSTGLALNFHQALEQLHQANGWTAPVAGCLDVLEKGGFVDCLHAARSQEVQSHEAAAASGGGADAAPNPNGERDAGDASVFTTPAHEPRVRVDYCFVRGAGVTVDHVRVLGAEGSQAALSDHRALVVDLVLPART